MSDGSGHYAALIPSALPALYARAAVEFEPREVGTVTQWADEHRRLSSKASGEPGRYSSARTPHLRAIMDDLSVDSPVQYVTVKKPAQGGATEVGMNWIGYVMDVAPASMLVVVPTLEVRKKWVRQRLDPMLSECPRLASIFDARSQRDGGNTEELKDFPGGMLILAGANSPASLSSMPICYTLLDELSRFPWEIVKEGDPVEVIEDRMNSFMRRKRLAISTPTEKGQCRISQEYSNSDMRELWVPCPHCSTLMLMPWQHADGSLGLEQSKLTGRIWYICRSCGAGIEEYSKTQMLADHRWIARHPERSAVHRGYTWNALLNAVGLGRTWSELLARWERAQNDTTKLKAFYNLSLALEWAEKSEGVESAGLIARAGKEVPEIPTGTLRVAAIDVQKDRLEFTLFEFDDGEQAWVLEHVILPGDTADGAVWDDLGEALDEHGVQLAGIDAGYMTNMVQAFVASRPWCVPTKGMDGMNRPLVQDERQRRARLRQRRKKGIPSEPLGVDTGKALLYSRLRKEKPGPGYIHFCDHPSLDAEYFAQLTAERLVTKSKGGRPYHEWVKDRPRNEALDCAVIGIAVFQMRHYIRYRARQQYSAPAPVTARPAAKAASSSSPRANRGGGREEFSL